MAPARTHENAQPALKQIDLAGTVHLQAHLQDNLHGTAYDRPTT